jgi:hypothetical protein
MDDNHDSQSADTTKLLKKDRLASDIFEGIAEVARQMELTASEF